MWVSGVYALIGVVVGAVATTGGQVYLDGRKVRRSGSQAKVLVGGELLHGQSLYRLAAKNRVWPKIGDRPLAVPRQEWDQNHSQLVGEIDVQVWEELVMSYALVEFDEARWSAGDVEVTEGLARQYLETADRLLALRRKLLPEAPLRELELVPADEKRNDG